ncbi:ankyrin repeat-containing domain protein [Trichoderma chlorosporum]
MNAHGQTRSGATHVRTRVANLNGNNFGDNARIHQGDQNIFVKYWTSSRNRFSGTGEVHSVENDKKDCRRSLCFRDIDARLQNISPVQPGTCEWFFETPLFQQWYHRKHDDGLLWIKGSPGTGKSTLMKRILEYCQAKEDYGIAAYFFNARGAELEQTPLGMLRSLLFQLLGLEASLLDQLLPIYLQKEQDHEAGDWEWREPELQGFLLSEISKCRSRPLLLIIDALDECSDHGVQRVAEFLENLSAKAMDDGITLKICLSSRHYPFVRFKRYREMVLEKEEQHDEDIINYISSNLTKGDVAMEEAIRQKSAGIFMWVVLVITILNKAYDDGKIEAMRRKLNEMPVELGMVFETLLNKDNPDKDETILILQCVLFAKRLLTPEEIYFALEAGTNSEELGMWDPLRITPDVIRRRITSSSRGLVEIRKGEKETVQFIHESVNDFLLRKRRLQSLDPGLAENPIAKGHLRLKECCMSYLMMESLRLPNENEFGAHFRVLDNGYRFPFVDYAASYVFDHAEESIPVGRTELLQMLRDEGVLHRVKGLHGYFATYYHVGRNSSLLHVLAARGLPEMVLILWEMGADINAKGSSDETALEAAIMHQQESTVKVLLGLGAKIGNPSISQETLLTKAFRGENKEILAMLIEHGARFNIMERLGNGGLLRKAIATGNKDIVSMVITKGENINAVGFRGNPLQRAAMSGKKEMVEFLIEKGAKVSSTGFYGNALQAAVAAGHIEIVRMLIDNGADVNERGLIGPLCREYTKPLSTAEAMVPAAQQPSMGFKERQLILEARMTLSHKKFKVGTWGKIYGTALHVAVYLERWEIVKLLIDRGAKI